MTARIEKIQAELSDVEIVALALYFNGRPLFVPEIQMLINRRMGIRISISDVQNAVYKNPDYFEALDSDFTVGRFRTAYELTEEGEELAEEIIEEFDLL